MRPVWSVGSRGPLGVDYNPTMFALLFYDYVKDIAERRGEFRPAHLSLAEEALGKGELRLAGAYADPLDGAVFIFRDRGAAERFAERDPYMLNGLVTRHWIRDWNVVIGG